MPWNAIKIAVCRRFAGDCCDLESSEPIKVCVQFQLGALDCGACSRAMESEVT